MNMNELRKKNTKKLDGREAKKKRLNVRGGKDVTQILEFCQHIEVESFCMGDFVLFSFEWIL